MITDSMNDKRKVVSLDLSDENMLEENEFRDNPWNNTEEGLIFTGPLGAVSTVSKPFSLYEELTYRVKCLLFFSRKRDLVCCISMT